MEISINLWAVLAAALASMVIGGLWYSPLLFGKSWIKMMGWSSSTLKSMQKSAGPSYAVGFLNSLVMAYVLAHFVDLSRATDSQGALVLAFWVWLGFVATVQLGSVLWEGRSIKLWGLNAAYFLVSLSVMSLVLTLWV